MEFLVSLRIGYLYLHGINRCKLQFSVGVSRDAEANIRETNIRSPTVIIFQSHSKNNAIIFVVAQLFLVTYTDLLLLYIHYTAKYSNIRTNSVLLVSFLHFGWCRNVVPLKISLTWVWYTCEPPQWIDCYLCNYIDYLSNDNLLSRNVLCNNFYLDRKSCYNL